MIKDGGLIWFKHLEMGISILLKLGPRMQRSSSKPGFGVFLGWFDIKGSLMIPSGK
jgi:hypothetical protein